MSSSHREEGTGIFVIEGGGSGSKAGNKNQEMMDREPLEMPVFRLQIDMDKGEGTTAAESVCIGLTPMQVEELVSNASRFGPEVVTAVKHLAPLLMSGELTSGAATTPAITQLGSIYHEEPLLKAFRRSISRMLENTGVKSIRPVIVASNGGGSGNALTRLIPMKLHDRTFRNRLLAGLSPFILEDPIVLTAYPFTYARNASTKRQEKKILANQYAWMREMDVLLYEGLVSHALSVGYSNSSGTVLSHPERMVDVLANSLHHFIRNYSFYMSRWLDSVPNPRTEPYLGIDLPELRYPSVRKLRTRFYGEEDLR